MNRRDFIHAAAAVSLGCATRADSAPPRIRIAQFGTTHSHAAGKLEAIRALPEIFEVAGVVERDAAKRAAAEKLRVYSGLEWKDEENILADETVRVVAIETALTDAPRAALTAIRAGKHVHLDKPGAADHADFEALRKEAERSGVTVQMGYMLRYNPAFELLGRAVREGWLGEITEIDAAMGKFANDAQRGTLREYPGAGMFELGCHLVDAVVTLLGKPSAVRAFSRTTRPDGDKLPDTQAAILEYPRAIVVLRCNHADPNGFARRRFSVAGTKGAMEIAPLESGKGTLTLAEPHGDFVKGENRFALELPGNRYIGEFRDLARVVRGGKKLAWDAAHDVAVHETALRAAGAWRE